VLRGQRDGSLQPYSRFSRLVYLKGDNEAKQAFSFILVLFYDSLLRDTRSEQIVNNKQIWHIEYKIMLMTCVELSGIRCLLQENL
jgi:hypothetical protein